MTGSPVLAFLLFTSYRDRSPGVEDLCNADVALSAWELACHASPTTVFAAQRLFALSVSARYRPSQTVPSGTQRARWPWPLRPEAKYRRGLPAPQHAWPGTDRPWMSAGVHRWPWRLSLTSSLSRRACADGCWPGCGAVGDVSFCCSRTPVTKGRPSSSSRARARARPTSASTRTQGARTGDSRGHIRDPRGRPVHGGRGSHRAAS